jgi:transcriptional antiterminator Rof (Rho-off)
VSEERSFDLDAAGLRADDADLAVGVEVLASKLEAALPAECRVERRARGLFDRRKVVETIEVSMGGARYSLRLDRGAVAASREQEVRGVVIKREPLSLEAWMRRLEDDLREQAQTSAQARAALERLLD